MKQDLYLNKLMSAENKLATLNPKAYRKEVCLFISLKTLSEKFNLVKCYDKNIVFSLWEKYRWGLSSFGQYMCPDNHEKMYLYLERKKQWFMITFNISFR